MNRTSLAKAITCLNIVKRVLFAPLHVFFKRTERILFVSVCFFIGLAHTVWSQQHSSQLSGKGSSGVLSVTVTTANPGGFYGSDNVMAAWVQNNSGTLVNTMMYFTANAPNTAQALSTWWSLIGGQWTDDKEQLDRAILMNVDGICGPTLVDGISSPTQPSIPSYGTRICYWGQSVDLNDYPDGVYTVGIEIANDFASVGSYGHQLAKVNFLKGPKSVRVTTADVLPGLTAIYAEWIPKPNHLMDSHYAGQYSILPNPVKSMVFVNGPNVRFIEILTLAGSRLLKSHFPALNIAFLPKGNYLMKIVTGYGTFVEPFLKL